MSDERTTLAMRSLAFRLIQDRLKDADSENRRAVAEAFPVKDRAVVWLPLNGEDVEVGHVRKDPGSKTASVVSMTELIDWCEANYPTEVEEYQPAPVTRVRPAFLDKLLAQAKADGAAVDPRTGEVVPGIDVRQGDPKILVVGGKTNEAKAALVEALRSDPYALQSLLQLPAVGA